MSLTVYINYLHRVTIVMVSKYLLKKCFIMLFKMWVCLVQGSQTFYLCYFTL